MSWLEIAGCVFDTLRGAEAMNRDSCLDVLRDANDEITLAEHLLDGNSIEWIEIKGEVRLSRDEAIRLKNWLEKVL